MRWELNPVTAFRVGGRASSGRGSVRLRLPDDSARSTAVSRRSTDPSAPFSVPTRSSAVGNKSKRKLRRRPRRMSLDIVGAGLVALIGTAGVLWPSQVGAQRTLEPSVIVAMAAAGEPVELRQVMIAGDLDLSGVGRITAPFRCIDCTVSGEFIASDVVFERVVDLSGLRTTGLNLRAAAFEAPLINHRRNLRREHRWSRGRVRRCLQGSSES